MSTIKTLGRSHLQAIRKAADTMRQNRQQAPTEARHKPIERQKVGSAYTTDDGQEIPSHQLHAVDCSCGYKAAVWMASEERALAIYERHTRKENPCSTD